MFLFAHKTKTPISTYADSFRPPNTMKKTFEEAPVAMWTENKFVTQVKRYTTVSSYQV